MEMWRCLGIWEKNLYFSRHPNVRFALDINNAILFVFSFRLAISVSLIHSLMKS